MAARILLLRWQFRERTAQRWIVEQGVVAEAVRAARRLGNPALHAPMKSLYELAVLNQSDDGPVPCRAIGYAAQFLQQQAIVGFVARAIARETGGADTRRAAQRV